MKRRMKLTYPQDKVREPLLFRMARDFNVMPNIRRARVNEEGGEIFVELEGSEADLESGIGFLRGQGVIVDLVEGDIIE